MKIQNLGDGGVRPVAGRGLAGLAAAALLAGVAGRFAPFHGHLDVLNDLCPLWLAVGLASALAAALLDNALRKVCLAIAAGLVLLALIIIGPELFTGAPGLSPPIPGTIKIVQFNLMKFNPRQAQTTAWIAAQHADVLVLEDARDEGLKVADTLASAYPYSVDCSADGNCSTIIMSKIRPSKSEALAHGDPENRQGLSAVSATFDGPGGSYTVVGVHLMRPWPMGERNRQLNELIGDVSRLPRSRLIVAGDFNASPWSFAMRVLDANLGLERRTRMLPTWPARTDTPRARAIPLPILPIDHVFAGPGWATVSVNRGPRLGSDHYPVVVELAPRPLN